MQQGPKDAAQNRSRHALGLMRVPAAEISLADLQEHDTCAVVIRNEICQTTIAKNVRGRMRLAGQDGIALPLAKSARTNVYKSDCHASKMGYVVYFHRNRFLST